MAGWLTGCRMVVVVEEEMQINERKMRVNKSNFCITLPLRGFMDGMVRD